MNPMISRLPQLMLPSSRAIEIARVLLRPATMTRAVATPAWTRPTPPGVKGTVVSSAATRATRTNCDGPTWLLNPRAAMTSPRRPDSQAQTARVSPIRVGQRRSEVTAPLRNDS